MCAQVKPNQRLTGRILELHVDRASTNPVYLQIAAGLRSLFSESGAAGASLPPERVLCDRYGVSRMTLRQAFDVLAHEGLISQERGRGTFVAQQPLHKQQQEFRSFSEEIAARGAMPSSRLISVETILAPAAARDLFGLSECDTVHRITRVRLASAVPLAVETADVPARLFPGLNLAPLHQVSLYEVMEREYGYRPVHAVEEISAALATARERKLLGLPRPAAILVIERRTYAANEVPVELTSAAIRSDLYRAVVRSTRPRP